MPPYELMMSKEEHCSSLPHIFAAFAFFHDFFKMAGLSPASLEGESAILKNAKTAKAERQRGKTLLFGQGLTCPPVREDLDPRFRGTCSSFLRTKSH